MIAAIVFILFIALTILIHLIFYNGLWKNGETG
jgi:hypothetical protein